MSIDTKELPKSFGPYTLKQKFAGGGMAEIYLAEAESPGGFVKPLVIKTIHRAYVNDERFASMFTEEAKILSSLTHGNIVPIFDFGSVDDMLYLAMELIDGVDTATLMEVCRSQGFTLPIEIALYIGIGTAAGLSHAHQAKDRAGKPLHIVHRDVSPQNILLSRKGEVKLCDFGLATRSKEEISPSGATNDEIKGKLKYLSPEQAAGMKVDKRSDLFSLGVVLYELVAGHHPVPSGVGVSVLRELAGGTSYPPLGGAAPWISKDVCDIINRALAFDVEKRFQTAEEMRAALAACLYRDYLDFSSETLAQMVIRVQTAAESSDVSDENGIVRVKLASFASSSRMRTSSVPPRNRKSFIVWIAAFLFAATVLASALIFLQPGRIVKPISPSTSPVSLPRTAPIETVRKPQQQARPALDRVDTAPGTSTDTANAPRQSPAKTDVRTNDTASEKEAFARKQKAFGFLNINASPWAIIEIDGHDYEGCPLIGIKLSAGRHKAKLKNAELGTSKTRYFTIKPNETSMILVDMESSE